ncbi:MAG: TonB family protein [Ghiorsea sp.]|nr:TonB family protein [Ghiorsea sp.]
MSKQGYVSLSVALCVALGVHSLVFLYLKQPNSQASTPHTLVMQVVILPQQAKPKPQPAKHQATQQKKHTPIFTTTQKKIATQQSTPHKKTTTTTPKSPQQPTPTTTNNKQQTPTEMLVVPKGVRQAILTHIQYPRQARRRGWQGKAEFQLDINNQSIQHITMLASTGYASLDRAAKKGLTTLDSLPLNDGRYSLAVVFQIQ